MISLGEEQESVFNTGCPSIDLAHEVKLDPFSGDPLMKYGGVGAELSVRRLYCSMHL